MAWLSGSALDGCKAAAPEEGCKYRHERCEPAAAAGVLFAIDLYATDGFFECKLVLDRASLLC